MRHPSTAVDSMEKRQMCEEYILPIRCLGQHVVHPMKCCWICGSSNPKQICHKEKVHLQGINGDEIICEAAAIIKTYLEVEE